MTEADSKITSQIAITTVILRELRGERGLHQAQVAEWLGKTSSAWNKVESGKSPLSFEDFVRVCGRLFVPPSTVFAATERYGALLGQRGWAVLHASTGDQGDRLMKIAHDYWGSQSFKLRALNPYRTPILSGPIQDFKGNLELAPVFQCAIDEAFLQGEIEGRALNFPAPVMAPQRW